MRMTETEKKVAEAARVVIGKAYARLLETYPDGDFQSSNYYKIELRRFIEILEDISRGRIRWNDYVIRNGEEGTKYNNVLQDMGLFFYNFLVNGHPNGDENWSIGENAIRRDEYIESSRFNLERRFEKYAIHEMLGAYIKQKPPGFESRYFL